MKYIALDIVATGPDPERHQILRVSAIADDTQTPDVPIEKLPTFDSNIDPLDVVGDPLALADNEDLLRTIASQRKTRWLGDSDPAVVLKNFSEWILDNGVVDHESPVITVGINPHKAVLPFLAHSKCVQTFVEYEPVDIRSIFLDKCDKKLPHMVACLVRGLGNSGSYIKNDSLNNASNIVRLMRAHFKGMYAH
jgi:hypothetical protein